MLIFRRLMAVSVLALSVCACGKDAALPLEGPIVGVRDAVVAFASPAALENGRSVARERIIVLVAPADGSAPKQVFTGCLPGLSQAERADLAQNENGLKSWAIGGEVGKIDIAAKEFGGTAVGALMQRLRSDKPSSSAGGLRSENYCKIDGLEQTLRQTFIIVDERSLKNEQPPEADEKNSLFASLAASRIFRTDATTSRIVLVSDDLPKPEVHDAASARKAALADAAKTPVDFGNSEVVVIGKGGNNDAARAYLQMYLLRLNGKLVSWSNDVSGVMPTAAPTSVRRYTGTARIPCGPNGELSADEIVRIRLATDAGGKLVNSWLVLTGAPYDRAIPMTGQGICDDAGNCKLRADNQGFANIWVAERNGQEVRWDNEAPFSGLREWALETNGSNLKGEIFDSAVSQVGCEPGQKSIDIQARLQPNSDI